MLDVKKWMAKVTKRLEFKPDWSNMIRPLSADQKSGWTYTVPKSGVLYITISSATRTYCSVKINDTNIADFAYTTTSPNATNIITLVVGTGDIVNVTNLSSSCYIMASRTSLVPYVGGST